jgi:hypothetical protein
VPTAGAACRGATAGAGAASVAGRDGGAVTPRTAMSWSLRTAAAACACWASASAAVTHA